MAAVNQFINKQALVNRLLSAKEATGKTFTQISREVGLTNVHTAQLFYNQAQLKPERVEVLKKAVPEIQEEDIKLMKRVPFRSYHESIAQEQLVYRLKEAVLHNGEAIHAICAEVRTLSRNCTTIDIFTEVQKVEGVDGNKRICIQLNGKFLPHIEQLEEKNTAPKTQ